jgi:hypothetical protein
MDDNLAFKNIISSASNSQGTDKGMILIPYAKDLYYKEGSLSFTLEFYNETAETEIGINMMISQELQDLLEGLISGDEV